MIVLAGVLSILGLLAVFVLVLFVGGSQLPRDHVASIEFLVRTGRAETWRALTDYTAMPTWWPAVKAIRTETLPDGTVLTWNLDKRGREMAFRTGATREAELLERIIVGETLPFGGTWTYELADAPDGGTRVTVTERGFVNPPFFRAVMKWFIGETATMRDFEKHFSAFCGLTRAGAPG